MLRHIVAILSALSIVLGGIMVLWPEGPAVFGWAIVAIGVIVFIWSAYEWRKDHANLKFFPMVVPMWKVSFSAEDWLPFRTLVPANVAIRQALNAVDDRRAGEAARKLGVSPLSYIWHALANEGAIQFWGTEPPATKLKKLPSSISAQGSLIEDQNAFRFSGAKTNSYENLHMLRRDLRAGIKRLKQWG